MNHKFRIKDKIKQKGVLGLTFSSVKRQEMKVGRGYGGGG